MYQFKNIKEFMAYFSDEKVCWDYLEKKCWDGKPVCPHCGCTKVYRLSNYKQFKCGNKKGCDRKFTVLVGTVMENTKIPVSTWMAAIYMFTQHKKEISALQLHRDLGISRKTAWFLLHRVREMFIKRVSTVELKDTVMVDETYVKGNAINRTKNQKRLIATGQRIDEPAVVLGMIDNSGNLVLSVVKNAESDTLQKEMNQHIDKEAVLVTDAHLSYRQIGEEYKGHIIINHSMGEYKNGEYSTNAAEGAFSWFKKTIFGTYHYVSHKHLQRYCAMFSYIYNTRKFSEPLRFDTTMSQLKGRLTYKKLIA